MTFSIQSRPLLSQPFALRIVLNGVHACDSDGESISERVVLESGALPSAQKKTVVPAPAIKSKFS
eukprot:COSAG02_NODE_7032_length_3218_cov_1.693171_2_plen_65_part_00